MFVENYRCENSESIMAGGDSAKIPYPKISDEDWQVWSTLLPVRSHNLDRIAAANFSTTSLHEGIPGQVALEVQRASRHFDKVEVWRKNQIEKDPIAVGVLGRERYLIARWGIEKLLPFEAIKKSMPLILAWKCATSPLGLTVEFAGVVLLAWNLILA
jgi:hypothetical protein